MFSLQGDSSRGFALVVNDLNNLPVLEYKRDGTVIQYAYDPTGNRVQKIVGSAYTWYVGGGDPKTEIIYINSTSNPVYNIHALDNVGQSKRSGTSLTRYYYLKDHLGDIRMTVTTGGSVDSYADYYPYGQQMDGRNLQGSADGRYKYTSKERDTESGYDCFGARYYDPRVGRFASVDRFDAKYPFMTPYAYAADNPVCFIDLNGDSVWIADENGNRSLFYPGMPTSGMSRGAQAIVSALNAANEYYSGSYVLGNLMSSKKSFTFGLDAMPLKREAGGLTMPAEDGSGGTVTYFGEGGPTMTSVTHELFHAWESYKGEYGESILSEVQAILFAGGITNQTIFGLTEPSHQAAASFQRAMEQLLVGFHPNDLESAINSFQRGSLANRNGLYESLPSGYSQGSRTIIKDIYPLTKRNPN